VKATVIPESLLPEASLTTAHTAAGNCVLIGAVWLNPDCVTILAGSAVAVSVKAPETYPVLEAVIA